MFTLCSNFCKQTCTHHRKCCHKQRLQANSCVNEYQLQSQSPGPETEFEKQLAKFVCSNRLITRYKLLLHPISSIMNTDDWDSPCLGLDL